MPPLNVWASLSTSGEKALSLGHVRVNTFSPCADALGLAPSLRASTCWAIEVFACHYFHTFWWLARYLPSCPSMPRPQWIRGHFLSARKRLDSQKHTMSQRHYRHRACIRHATDCRPLSGGSDVGEVAAMPYTSTANPSGFRRHILRSPGDLGRAPVALCIVPGECSGSASFVP